MKSYIYLASPYTAFRDDGSFDDTLMEERHRMITQCYYNLLAAGMVVYSPITMTYSAELIHRGIHGTWMNPKFWYEFDKPFLQHASQLFVLTLPGWKNSTGVTEEIEIAKGRNMPIVYLEFNYPHAHILGE